MKDRSLRLLVTLLAALAGLQGLVMGVLVIIATVDWGVSKGLYGLFLAAGAAGNVPGALLADRVSHRIGNVPTLIASALVSGLAYLVMASATGMAARRRRPFSSSASPSLPEASSRTLFASASPRRT